MNKRIILFEKFSLYVSSICEALVSKGAFNDCEILLANNKFIIFSTKDLSTNGGIVILVLTTTTSRVWRCVADNERHHRKVFTAESNCLSFMFNDFPVKYFKKNKSSLTESIFSIFEPDIFNQLRQIENISDKVQLNSAVINFVKSFNQLADDFVKEHSIFFIEYTIKKMKF